MSSDLFIIISFQTVTQIHMMQMDHIRQTTAAIALMPNVTKRFARTKYLYLLNVLSSYTPCIRSMGVYCFQVVRDSDFVSAQYLENELMEFDKVLHIVH